MSLTAPLIVTGNKKTGRKITVGDYSFEFREQRLKRILELILSRLARKSGPKYQGVDLLVVPYDDYLGFRKPEEVERLRAEVSSSGLLSRLNFRTLVLLGASGETFVEFSLSCEPSAV